MAGRLDLDALGRRSDEAVIDTLVAFHGVGRWTADIYLLMGLGRPDVWPAGDLALIIAARSAKGLPSDAPGPRWRCWQRHGGHIARRPPACCGTTTCSDGDARSTTDQPRGPARGPALSGRSDRRAARAPDHRPRSSASAGRVRLRAWRWIIGGPRGRP
ncbi:MAG: hypothetical protein R3C32_11875 [Chloroflexota bacterium]